MPDQNEEASRRETYNKHVAQAWADQQASSDAFDNNLLTFSSAALGLSLAFIKDVVPLQSAEWLRWLYCSWISFGGCIVVTIASFQFAVQSQRLHSQLLARFYLQNQQHAFDKANPWTRAITTCAVTGSLLLVLGVISTVVFASKNVTHYKEMKRWQTTNLPTK